VALFFSTALHLYLYTCKYFAKSIIANGKGWQDLHGVRMMDQLSCHLCQVNMKGALRECYAHNLAQCPTLRMSIIKHAQLSRTIISQTKASLFSC